ncbi:MAG: T9SS C-terminal target domain-containing protein [Calditrichaeota bacterium]|nr:MAG: T9SS C-terminal target domain-containing protein [Calditrichota bacterium]
MKTLILFVMVLLFTSPFFVHAQTNEWMTQYVTLDDAVNGTGERTASVAALGPDNFVALVARLQSGEGLFGAMEVNYLVGYMNADSLNGRVAFQEYDPASQFEVWSSGLDQVTFEAAWQIAGGKDNLVYVANNDPTHNILVFQLTELGVIPTDFRMETGSENIYAIEVDTAGYVYVVDYEGSDQKTDEVKVFAPIGAPGTTWDVPGGHNDPPVTTIDLPPGIYQGITVSSDGSQLFISATSERSLWKFVGDPVNGYTRDTSFDLTLSPDDTVGNGGTGTPSFLGLAYLDDPGVVFAAVDTFLSLGVFGGYPYGRIYVVDPVNAVIPDTIDIAAWNLKVTGSFNSGSSNGRAGGFTSVYDVDVEPTEPAVYTQSYYGWAVEKWVFNGDLGTIVSVEQLSQSIPENFSLKQNYPNPFNPSTTIEFDIKQATHVKLNIYNILGYKVKTLVNEYLVPGSYKIVFEGENLPSGVYYYTIQAGAFKDTRKMIWPE